MKRKIQITVIGDSREIEINNQIAYSAGKIIAETGAVLLTGGRGGVMEAASRGASEIGGTVVALLPDSSFSSANPYADIVIPTGIGFARNSMNVLSADIVVAVGGGAGTLCEMAYAWAYRKPVIACSWASGWSEKLAGEKIDDNYDSEIIDAKDLDELRELLQKLSSD